MCGDMCHSETASAVDTPQHVASNIPCSVPFPATDSIAMHQQQVVQLLYLHGLTSCYDEQHLACFALPGSSHLDAYRMALFKVLPCRKSYNHDWTACPYAHLHERARRRCLLVSTYHARVCPDLQNTGSCPRGEDCPMTHSMFEYWMHPKLYRSKMCREGAKCSGMYCFFAHSRQELRTPCDGPFAICRSGHEASARPPRSALPPSDTHWICPNEPHSRSAGKSQFSQQQYKQRLCTPDSKNGANVGSCAILRPPAAAAAGLVGLGGPVSSLPLSAGVPAPMSASLGLHTADTRLHDGHSSSWVAAASSALRDAAGSSRTSSSTGSSALVSISSCTAGIDTALSSPAKAVPQLQQDQLLLSLRHQIQTPQMISVNRLAEQQQQQQQQQQIQYVRPMPDVLRPRQHNDEAAHLALQLQKLQKCTQLQQVAAPAAAAVAGSSSSESWQLPKSFPLKQQQLIQLQQQQNQLPRLLASAASIDGNWPAHLMSISAAVHQQPISALEASCPYVNDSMLLRLPQQQQQQWPGAPLTGYHRGSMLLGRQN